MNYDIQCEVSMVLCIDWNHQGIIESVLLLSTIAKAGRLGSDNPVFQL